MTPVRFATTPRLRHPTPPTLVERFLCPCGHRWPTLISFVNSFQSNILDTDMLFGSPVHQNRITLSKWATLVLYAVEDSTVFSTLYFRQKINPAYRSIMNNLFPSLQIILAGVLLVPIITARTESTWSSKKTFMLLGSFDSQSNILSLILFQSRRL